MMNEETVCLTITIRSFINVVNNNKSKKIPPTVTTSFRSWLKANTNMKLSSDAAVLRITYEGITTFKSLNDFDKRASIHSL